MTARLLPLIFMVVSVSTALGADSWRVPDLASPDDVHLAGIWGAAQTQNANRLAIAPLDEPAFILDDVSLKQHRKFAEYSGDISGRWIGAAALASVYWADRPDRRRTVLFGVAIGLACLSKFSALLFLPAALLAMHRGQLWRHRRSLAIACAVAKVTKTARSGSAECLFIGEYNLPERRIG